MIFKEKKHDVGIFRLEKIRVYPPNESWMSGWLDNNPDLSIFEVASYRILRLASLCVCLGPSISLGVDLRVLTK